MLFLYSSSLKTKWDSWFSIVRLDSCRKKVRKTWSVVFLMTLRISPNLQVDKDLLGLVFCFYNLYWTCISILTFLRWFSLYSLFHEENRPLLCGVQAYLHAKERPKLRASLWAQGTLTVLTLLNTGSGSTVHRRHVVATSARVLFDPRLDYCQPALVFVPLRWPANPKTIFHNSTFRILWVNTTVNFSCISFLLC